MKLLNGTRIFFYELTSHVKPFRRPGPLPETNQFTPGLPLKNRPLTFSQKEAKGSQLPSINFQVLLLAGFVSGENILAFHDLQISPFQRCKATVWNHRSRISAKLSDFPPSKPMEFWFWQLLKGENGIKIKHSHWVKFLFSSTFCCMIYLLHPFCRLSQNKNYESASFFLPFCHRRLYLICCSFVKIGCSQIFFSELRALKKRCTPFHTP